MITSIEIENLRGIRTGKLEGLAPLTILTGPNACGKSTVLDALLIGASTNPAEAVGRAVERHPTATVGARFLVTADQRQAICGVRSEQYSWRRFLSVAEDSGKEAREHFVGLSSVPPYTQVEVSTASDRGGELVARIFFDRHNLFKVDNSVVNAGLGAVKSARLVDPGIPAKLHRTYSDVLMAGRRDAVIELLGPLLPGFERLEILAVADDEFVLGITRDGRTVPVSLSGDGIQALLQLALEVAEVPDGLVLVEEPEVYQHPKAIWQSARALLANMRRGVQMVITTHSLELIDALISESSEEDREKMALFNLALEEGVLQSGRRSGEEMRFAREELDRDLR